MIPVCPEYAPERKAVPDNIAFRKQQRQMKEKFSRKYTITAADIDPEYRMTVNSVLVHFQDCIALFLARHGLAAFDLAERDIMWVISDFNVSMSDRRPLWSDNIEVEVWVSEKTPLRMYVDFQLLDSEHVIFASGNSCWNTIVRSTKRIMPCDTLTASIPASGERAMGEHRRQEFPQPGELITSMRHIINISDLDFNGHVGNRSYLAIASQTAPESYLAAHALRHVGVKFLRESFLHDELVCELYRCDAGPDRFVHLIKRADNGAAVCRIYSEWSEATDRRNIGECLRGRIAPVTA